MIEKFRNKFIVFEGADSCGKSSVCDLFVDYLNKNGIDTVKTFQPGDTQWGTLASTLRSLCKDKRWNLSKEGNLFAFLLDRAECIDKIIRPALKSGKTCVIDRFTFSTIAYQLYGKQIMDEINSKHGQDVALALYKWFKDPYLDCIPDIVYYFPEKVGNRKDDDNDLFDKATKEFNDRVQNAYNLMAKEFNWKIVKPGKSAEETLENLLNV